MAIPGWQQPESPFHPGEQAIQERFGARDRMETLGRRMIRDFLPDQHQQFYAQLPFILAGTVDADGRPWASILTGAPGFISAPTDRELHLATHPAFGDPLADHLAVGTDIGFLGIELHTRRRNRVNGTVSAIADGGFSVRVAQTFGNCPKYIQARHFERQDFDPRAPKPTREIITLGDAEREAIAAADTFFIATAYLDDAAGSAKGVDVSHRGGNPGFVRLDADDTLTVPDFLGNCHFNTFGNIELNPRAGLLFVDFARGDLLYLTGRAEVIWDGEEVAAYAGAQRLLRVFPERGRWVEGSLPWRWSPPEVSPFLSEAGPWTPARSPR